MAVVSSALHADSTQNLRKEDVPGASLAGRDPKMLSFNVGYSVGARLLKGKRLT